MYIRTKNRIYQVESIVRDDGFVKGYNVGEMAFIRKEQVIKQSEKLEDLIDNSIYIIDGLFGEERKITWYGAIYAEKGIITVAKTNDKGDWELI